MNSSDLVVADLNCDGSLDLAVTNVDSNHMSPLANSGIGTIGIAQLVATGLEPVVIGYFGALIWKNEQRLLRSNPKRR